MIRPGVEAISNVLARLNNVHHTIPRVIHIAGTNGKGSVAAMLRNALLARFGRVGSFTSPALVEERDMVALNGVMPTVEEWQIARQDIPAVESLTPFETITVAALRHLVKSKVDVAVIECGMGGRLDCTNVFTAQQTLACVITMIDYDHTEFLGRTIEEITFHKAGIIKPNVPVIVSKKLNRVSLDVIKSEMPDEGLLHIADVTPPTWELALKGEHQRENAGIAVKVIDVIFGDDKAMKENVRTAAWPGRLEWWGGSEHKYSFLLDGAHNLSGARTLNQYLSAIRHQFKNKRIRVVWVLAVLKTKNAAEMLKELIHEGDVLITVPIASKKNECVAPADLAALAVRVCPFMAMANDQSPTENAVFACEDLPSGIALALSLDKQANNRVKVVAGSLYLVGEFKSLHRQ